jgi:hypothetical protein
MVLFTVVHAKRSIDFLWHRTAKQLEKGFRRPAALFLISRNIPQKWKVVAVAKGWQLTGLDNACVAEHTTIA